MICLARISHSDLDISVVLLVIVGITYLNSCFKLFSWVIQSRSILLWKCKCLGYLHKKIWDGCIADGENERQNKGMTEIMFLFLEQLPQTKPRRRIKASRWNRFDWGSSYSSEALSWIEFKEELRSQEAQLADCTKWVWHEEFSHSEQKPGINNFDGKFPHQNVHLFKLKFVQWFHCFIHVPVGYWT